MKKIIAVIAILALILSFAGCGKKCPHANQETQMQRDPYCNSDGYTGDVVCLDCEKILQPGEPIPAFGHDPVTMDPFPATCLDSGWTSEIICKTCDTVLEEPKEIPAKGHTGDKVCEECGMALDEKHRRNFPLTFGGKVKIGCDREIFPAVESDVFKNDSAKVGFFENFGVEGRLFFGEVPASFDPFFCICHDFQGILTGLSLGDAAFIFAEIFFKDLLIIILQGFSEDAVPLP